jgi:hypothetical protein
MAQQHITVGSADPFHALGGIIAHLCDLFVCHAVTVPQLQNIPVHGINDILVNGIAHVASLVV